jgi:hypothetical protein
VSTLVIGRPAPHRTARGSGRCRAPDNRPFAACRTETVEQAIFEGCRVAFCVAGQQFGDHPFAVEHVSGTHCLIALRVGVHSQTARPGVHRGVSVDIDDRQLSVVGELFVRQSGFDGSFGVRAPGE